jgi:succinyl-CoA synthetase beta subunit
MGLMKEYGVPVPRGAVATTPAEAERAYAATAKAGGDLVIKAQVLAGGRGLGKFLNGFHGGVHLVTRPGQAAELASKMLGQHLVTKQTGAEGRRVDKVYLMERLYLRRETYFSIMLDRSAHGPLIVASPKGGTSIEDVAAETPEAILKMPVDQAQGPTPAQLAKVAEFCGFSGKAAEQYKACVDGADARGCRKMPHPPPPPPLPSPPNKSATPPTPLPHTHPSTPPSLHPPPTPRANTHPRAPPCSCVANLWKMFKATDSTMLEINPLAETPEGDVFVCDAKINFDDNSAFRQAEIFKQRDFSQEDPREVEASKYDLNYIGLDGSIGCMVNGAGLAMATMDIIQLHGGSPANFLDVGGGANAEQVTRAFELLNSDKKVDAILVNIFGGIMRCDVIAQGVITAVKTIGLKKPVVLRLQGTNVKEARALIAASGYKIIAIDVRRLSPPPPLPHFLRQS